MTGFALLAVVLFARSPTGEALSLLAFAVATGFRILPSVARLLGGYNGMRIGLPALWIVLDDVKLARMSPPAARGLHGTTSVAERTVPGTPLLPLSRDRREMCSTTSI